MADNRTELAMKMLDLKLCLLDLIRPSGSCSKPKKSLKDICAKYPSDLMQKYNDVNVIFFNENMSMTSKYEMRQFAGNGLGYYTSYNLSSDFPSGSDSYSRRSSKSRRGYDSESCKLDFSSGNGTESEMEYTSFETDNLTQGNGVDQLDSFCTLCTSTFSYTQCCRFCENSLCGSKCDSESSPKEQSSFKFQTARNQC